MAQLCIERSLHEILSKMVKDGQSQCTSIVICPENQSDKMTARFMDTSLLCYLQTRPLGSIVGDISVHTFGMDALEDTDIVTLDGMPLYSLKSNDGHSYFLRVRIQKAQKTYHYPTVLAG